MSDIVERLRSTYWKDHVANVSSAEAADEIERLRNVCNDQDLQANRNAAEIRRLCVRIGEQNADNERLRGLLRDTLERIEVLADPNRVNAHLAVLVELTASRAKIRAALAGAADRDSLTHEG